MSRNWGWRAALLALCVVLASCGGDGDSPSVAVSNLSAAAHGQRNENDDSTGNEASRKTPTCASSSTSIR